MSVINELINTSSQKALTRLWLISDLQQREPQNAEKFLSCAMNDFKNAVKLPVDGICYLGDSSEGIDREKIDCMTSMQIQQFELLHVPIYYAMGNHELDFYKHAPHQDGSAPELPFYNAVKTLPLWNCISSQEDICFFHDFGCFFSVFLSDHASSHGDWYATHGCGNGTYPYTSEDYQKINERIAAAGKPVFLFSHYPFPGGNRPSDLMAQMLPLPQNVRAHFYGHAHIGDAAWAKENLFRKISCVENQSIMQFDISSLDNLRGSTVRSAFFEYYGDGEYSVFWRDHKHALWEDFFLSRKDSYSLKDDRVSTCQAPQRTVQSQSITF